jgi:hypothetical protein
MSWTKRQYVEKAFEEIGYASYAFDLQPEQLQAALRRLDSMMAVWNSKSIKLGYPLPDSPSGSDLDQDTHVPDRANEAVYTNLAVRIASLVGKVVPQETKSIAKSAYTALLAQAATPREIQLPRTMPAGAGNKPWRVDTPFLEPVDDGVITPPDDTLEFLP